MKSNTLLLAVISILLLVTLYTSYTNSQEIKTLRQENTELYSKIDSVLQICREQPQQPTAAEAETAPQSLGNTLVNYLTKLGENVENVASGTSKKRIVVDTKYRLEDRYVESRVHRPEIKGDEVGCVVISIQVNWLGKVSSAKLKSATGITNEDVIEACKKAALRTGFNYDPDTNSDKKQPGTITYTFSAK